jgi:hypothetical protein
MKKLFPKMNEHIGGGYIFCIFAVWVVAFLLVPAWLPLLAGGFQNNFSALSWFETVLTAVLGIVMLLVMKEYLKDAFLYVQIGAKGIFSTAAIALALMVAWVLMARELLAILWIDPASMFYILPITPTNVLLPPGVVVENNHIVGLLSMTLLAPFGVCGMLYVSGFAPVCTRSSWLGYLTMAGLALFIAIADSFWYWAQGLAYLAFFVRLPVHMFACWSYQKTDNVWTPIFALAGFNLLTSLVNILLA